MHVHGIGPDTMLGEYPDHGGHAADRGRVGAEVMSDQWVSIRTIEGIR
jgi:hypothetical protein